MLAAAVTSKLRPHIPASDSVIGHRVTVNLVRTGASRKRNWVTLIQEKSRLK